MPPPTALREIHCFDLFDKVMARFGSDNYHWAIWMFRDGALQRYPAKYSYETGDI